MYLSDQAQKLAEEIYKKYLSNVYEKKPFPESISCVDFAGFPDFSKYIDELYSQFGFEWYVSTFVLNENFLEFMKQ